MKKLLLLFVTLLPLGSSQNSSLKINTHLKDIADGPVALASIQGPGNICIREEPYVEHVQVPEMQPVRVRTSSWCMEIPPRCATYKTEMREVMRVQVSCTASGALNPEFGKRPNGRRCSIAGSAFAGVSCVTIAQPVATPSQWPAATFPPSWGACARNLISICPTRKPLTTLSINCPDPMADFDSFSHIFGALYEFCPRTGALRNSREAELHFLCRCRVCNGERKSDPGGQCSCYVQPQKRYLGPVLTRGLRSTSHRCP